MHKNITSTESFQAVSWQNNHIHLLDQRQLPHQEIYLEYFQATKVAEAIRDMVVRGAPAIGITAAYAVVLAAREAYAQSQQEWKEIMQPQLSLLSQARPTAVNLHWAINRMQQCIAGIDTDPEAELLELALSLHQQDIEANRIMGKLGADLVNESCSVMTHCNAGALATGGYGTALGVIRTLYQQKKLNHVYVSETRPWLQGARLSAWELHQDQIPVTLMTDSAASSLMKKGEISWLIVGADRIVANGDVTNKVGTYTHALAARYHRIGMMVVAPLSSIDMSIQCGEQVPIENRNASEVTCHNGQSVGPEGISAINPAFDITPADLVDVIVTEKGVIRSPNSEKMQALFG